MWKHSNMLLNILVIGFVYAVNADSNDSVIYNSFTGVPATQEELEAFEAAGITSTCTNVVETCDADFWRMVDGSCNNLNYVDRGMFCTPQLRLMEPDFYIDNGTYQPRLTQAGNPYGYARDRRQRLLAVGSAVDADLTQAVAYILEFIFGDIGSVHDISNYLFQKTYCCSEEGKSDFMCTPNIVLDTDNVHRFSNVRCMNMTRPLAFQNIGCTSSDTPPDRVDFSTSLWDISNIYAFSEGITPRIRANSSGLLKTETVDGKDFPSSANESTTCLIQDAIDTGCTRDVPNGLIGTNLFSTLFWRWHNFIAKILYELNPCWDNDRLFYTARDINIALYVQIMYYELMPILFGKDRMISEGIITEDMCERDLYDPYTPPQMALESSYCLRYFHTIQDSKQKKYDENDTLVGTSTVTKYSLRVQDFAVDNEMALVVHGMHIQSCAAFDNIVDPEIAENGTGVFQHALDITAFDLAKGGLFGFQPYAKVREFCTNKSYTTFDDLADVISEENLDSLKYNYEDVLDVELLAGIWMEDKIEGGHAPPTVACLLMNQMKRSMVTDRHWYERPNRPHAFTTDQLAEIRKSSLARLLCDVGDVPRIQPQAFLNIGPENEMTTCDSIPDIDFTLWQDESCSADC